MAILHGIEVNVLVNSQPLPEYDDDDMDNSSPNLIVKNIEAVSGKKFDVKASIRGTFNPTPCDILLRVFLDGHYVNGAFAPRDQIGKPDFPCPVLFQGVEQKVDEAWNLLPFIFSEIIHEEESSKVQPGPRTNQLDKVGTITLKVYRVIMLEEIVDVRPFQVPDSLSKVTKLAEKSFKGKNLTHSAQLGEKQSCSGRKTRNCRYIDGAEHPIAVFVFKYRSRATLQSMLLVPRTPSSAPLEDRPVADLTLEEARELLVRQQARLNAKNEPKIKQETKAEPDHGTRRERDAEYEEILASAQVKKVKVANSTASGEVINLDGD